METQTKWKNIEGWENLYEVSNYGAIRNKLTGHVLVGDTNSSGYRRVCLYKKGHDPEKERVFIHRMVAEYFVPNKYCLPEVNHIDGDKMNNTFSNLEWVSRAENELHSKHLGTKPYHPFLVIYSNGTSSLFETTGELCKVLPVTRRTVTNWLKRLNHGYEKYRISSITYV